MFSSLEWLWQQGLFFNKSHQEQLQIQHNQQLFHQAIGEWLLYFTLGYIVLLGLVPRYLPLLQKHIQQAKGLDNVEYIHTTPQKQGSGMKSKSPVQEASLDKVEELVNRVLSTVHALVACMGSLHWFLSDMGYLGSKALITTEADFMFSVSPIRTYYLAVTFSYLTFDLVRIIYVSFIQPLLSKSSSSPLVYSMVFHHVTIMMAFYLAVYYNFGTFYTALFLHNELTTPLLNLRAVMALLELKENQYYVWNEIIFMVGFVVDRILVNGYIVYHLQQRLDHLHDEFLDRYPTLPVYLGLPCFAYSHLALQVWWLALIIRLVYRKYVNVNRSMTSKKQEDALTQSFEIIESPSSSSTQNLKKRR